MVKKEELFALIKSLTRSEKRYFKVYSTSSNDGSKYLKLFEAIESQDTYDEDAILKKFQGETFIKQLHVIKNYLRQMIMKSLRNFHSGESADLQVKESLMNAALLYNKELYRHCRNELLRAERIAIKYELDNGLIEIYHWLRRLDQAESPHDYPKFRESLSKQNESFERARNYHDYLKLIVDVSDSVYATSDVEVSNASLLDDPANARSLEALIMHYNARSFRTIQSDPDGAAASLHELLDILENQRHRIDENPGMYIGCVNNLVTYYVYEKRFDEALELVQRAKTVYDQWKLHSENRNLMRQMIRTYNIELEIYRDTMDFEGAPEYLDGIGRFVDRYEHKMPHEYLVSFWFQLSYIHFQRKDLRSALKWINNIMSARFPTVREDIFRHSRMLNLMIHLEQNNLFVLRYFVDSTRRFLKKQEQIHDYERLLLRFFSRIARAPLLEYRKLYQQLKNDLFPGNGDSMITAEVLDYIDFRKWLEEKS